MSNEYEQLKNLPAEELQALNAILVEIITFKKREVFLKEKLTGLQRHFIILESFIVGSQTKIGITNAHLKYFNDKEYGKCDVDIVNLRNWLIESIEIRSRLIRLNNILERFGLQIKVETKDEELSSFGNLIGNIQKSLKEELKKF